MQFRISCPECSSDATIELKDDEVENIKKAIHDKGRSPTLLSKCDKGHELLVTLYFRDGVLGIRDVIVPLDTGKPRKKLAREIDWVRSAFGGEE